MLQNFYPTRTLQSLSTVDLVVERPGTEDLAHDGDVVQAFDLHARMSCGIGTQWAAAASAPALPPEGALPPRISSTSGIDTSVSSIISLKSLR